MDERVRNQKDANKEVNKDKRYSQIISILTEKGALIPRKIEDEMVTKGYVGEFNLNDVRPRLTELLNLHKVKIIGKEHDQVSGKNNSIYALDDWHYSGEEDQMRMELYRNY